MTDSNLSPPQDATTPPATTTSSPPPTTTSPPPPVPADTRPKDPRIAALHSMFPDYDELILYSVLDSVNGSQDRAIEALLGMSDPEYKPEPQPEVVAPVQTQEDLDEQLARRLMLEEQEQHQAAWVAQQETRRPQWARNSSAQQQPTHQYQGQQGQGQAGDTMTEIQQQLGKFAETGKKTIGSLFSKVKAKIQEMDQPRSGTSGQSWSSGSNSYDPAQYEQNLYQQQQLQQQQQQNVPYSQYHGQNRHAVLAMQQPAYYDPNVDSDSSLSLRRQTSQSPPIILGGGGMQGYDVTPEAAARSTPPLPTNPVTTPPTSDPRLSSGLTSPPIDGGKFGLLPKRPVALLRPGEPAALERSQSHQSQDESDDGLEYAESPFDEGKK